MLRKSTSRLVPLAAAALLLAGTVGTVDAANPSSSYSFTACWDDGLVTTFVGVRGLQSWSAIRVNAVSFGFANIAFGESYTIPAARIGSERSGWHTPQSGGGAFVGALYNGRRVVATGSVLEPTGGWNTLPACPVG